MPETAPLITVITPAYNVGPWIGEAVDSVLRQTFSDFEYLVVDDGSTDDTVEQVKARCATDARLRLIENDHAGAATARNTAIDQARGQYIAFLDGDDRWHTEFLGHQLGLLRSLPADVAAVFCRSRVMSESGRVYLARWQRAGECDLDRMLVDSTPPRVGSSLLLKKTAFDQAGVFDVDLASSQDREMWLRIQRDSAMPLFWANPRYLMDIRVRPGAISRNHRKRYEAQEKIISEYAPSMNREPRGGAYVRPAVFAFRSGDEEFALKWAAEARTAGLAWLLRDSYGRRVLAWSALSTDQRGKLRGATNAARKLIGRAIGATAGLQR